jgi:hypothetical protein
MVGGLGTLKPNPSCHALPVVCVADWHHNCPLDIYEDGITGVLYKIFTTSPWVGWIGLNAVFHMFWVTGLFCCQIYQVSLVSVARYTR